MSSNIPKVPCFRHREDHGHESDNSASSSSASAAPKRSRTKTSPKATGTEDFPILFADAVETTNTSTAASTRLAYAIATVAPSVLAHVGRPSAESDASGDLHGTYEEVARHTSTAASTRLACATTAVAPSILAHVERASTESDTSKEVHGTYEEVARKRIEFDFFFQVDIEHSGDSEKLPADLIDVGKSITISHARAYLKWLNKPLKNENIQEALKKTRELVKHTRDWQDTMIELACVQRCKEHGIRVGRERRQVQNWGDIKKANAECQTQEDLKRIHDVLYLHWERWPTWQGELVDATCKQFGLKIDDNDYCREQRSGLDKRTNWLEAQATEVRHIKRKQVVAYGQKAHGVRHTISRKNCENLSENSEGRRTLTTFQDWMLQGEFLPQPKFQPDLYKKRGPKPKQKLDGEKCGNSLVKLTSASTSKRRRKYQTDPELLTQLRLLQQQNHMLMEALAQQNPEVAENLAMLRPEAKDDSSSDSDGVNEDRAAEEKAVREAAIKDAKKRPHRFGIYVKKGHRLVLSPEYQKQKEANKRKMKKKDEDSDYEPRRKKLNSGRTSRKRTSRKKTVLSGAITDDTSKELFAIDENSTIATINKDDISFIENADGATLTSAFKAISAKADSPENAPKQRTLWAPQDGVPMDIELDISRKHFAEHSITSYDDDDCNTYTITEIVNHYKPKGQIGRVLVVWDSGDIEFAPIDSVRKDNKKLVDEYLKAEGLSAAVMGIGGRKEVGNKVERHKGNKNYRVVAIDANYTCSADHSDWGTFKNLEDNHYCGKNQRFFQKMCNGFGCNKTLVDTEKGRGKFKILTRLVGASLSYYLSMFAS